MYHPHPFLAPALFLPALVYEAAVKARNALYSSGWISSARLPGTVISIGNLTLGGTGKTPLVIHTARLVANWGMIPALLSRGYGRTETAQWHVVPPHLEILSPESVLGDEPALVRRHVPDVWLGISADRYAVGRKILERTAEPVFLLDDGFQHRQLERDLDIVIIDRTQPLLQNRIFPLGSLREPVDALCRADVLMINGPGPERDLDDSASALGRIHPRARIFRCCQRIQALVPFEQWRLGNSKQGTLVASAFLVAAVGNPSRLHADVEGLGIAVRGSRFLRDHTRLRNEDWRACAAAASAKCADAIVTTEKDAVKISSPPDFPLLVAVQVTEVAEAQEFERLLRGTLEKKR